jgi:predicted DCC family thiol-disulfide oxidoreductase YuxK
MTNITKKKTIPHVTVWYDSDCPMCIREISLMRRLDKRHRINFVEIQTAVGCPIGTDELMKRFHAQERGEPIVSGAAAFAAMWRAVPVLRPLGLLARFRPVLWILERLYRGFLVIRPWLQRRVRQMVET